MISNDAQKLNFVFFDTETTGTNVVFDQIIQFSAILTDQSFKEIYRINVKCRRLPWVIPSPGAMIVTGIGPNQIDDPNISLFPDMMNVIYEKIKAWSPAIFIGYKSFRFDEPLLQRAFWQSLKPPYVTVTNGNGRGDLLFLVRAVSKLAPFALSIPNIASGRPSFKLDLLAPLNGFSHQNAHDALNDTQAVVHICKKIASRVPKLWNSFVLRSQKKFGTELLNLSEPIYFAEPSISGKLGWWGKSIGVDNKSKTVFVRLDADWDRFFSTDKSLQKKLIVDSMFRVRRIKENKMPIALSMSDAASFFGIVPSKKEESLAQIFMSEDKKAELMDLIPEVPELPEATVLEQKIYEGFPDQADEDLMQQFWALQWPERAALVRKFKDSKLQQLSQRLIFLMAPESLAISDKQRIEQGIKDRLLDPHSDKSLWRTISLARIELEELRESFKKEEAMLGEIVSWLSAMEVKLLSA